MYAIPTVTLSWPETTINLKYLAPTPRALIPGPSPKGRRELIKSSTGQFRLEKIHKVSPFLHVRAAKIRHLARLDIECRPYVRTVHAKASLLQSRSALPCR